MCVPFLKDTTVPELFLVVPMAEYNQEVPVIVGTNIIRECKIASVDIASVPTAWQTAFTAVCSNRVGVVKTTTKVTLQPYETRTVTGLVRKNFNAEAALTEPVEDKQTARVTVCPRIVRTDKPGNTARIPVRLCNMSARIVTIQPKESICNLEQVKDLNRDPVKDLTAADKGADEQDDTKAAGVDNKMDFNLEGAT